MSSIVNDLATSFEIRELTGDKRTLKLTGRALPYRPFELSGTQRNSIEWYPGSPIGTLQVYGAKEEPTTITGAWKDAFIGAHTTGAGEACAMFDDELGPNWRIDTARELVKIVDDMRRKGQEIEVTWLDQARRGIIERFTVRWDNGHDCAWDIAFSWISQAESMADIPMVDDSATDLGDLPNKVQGVVDDLGVDAADLVPQAGDRFADVASDLNSVGASIQIMADELTDVVVQIAGAIAMPGESLRRAAGILDGMKLEGQLLCDIAEKTADGIALDTGGLAGFSISFGKVLSQRSLIRRQSNAAAALRNLAAREQMRLLASITSEVIKIFQAREGQDLREVSQAFYGTPDMWRGLMVYNNLDGSDLLAGQVVFVPAQPPDGGC